MCPEEVHIFCCFSKRSNQCSLAVPAYWPPLCPGQQVPGLSGLLTLHSLTPKSLIFHDLGFTKELSSSPHPTLPYAYKRLAARKIL